MKSFVKAIPVLLACALPLHAAPGEITISSFIRVTENVGEVRGKVALNQDKGALVTVENGPASYSTATDAAGNWGVLIALRANTVKASARALDGSGAQRDVVEASVAANPPVGPAPAELYSLTKSILTGETAANAAAVTRLAALMDASIMHAGGWEFDNRMVLLLLGCTGRALEHMGTATASEQHVMSEQLSKLGALLYKGVVRGLDGNPPGQNAK